MDKLITHLREWVTYQEKYSDIYVTDGGKRIYWFEETPCCDVTHSIILLDESTGAVSYTNTGMANSLQLLTDANLTATIEHNSGHC